MSELSYIEKLLDGVEVEWRDLEEVVKIQRGKRLVKSQLETSGNYAVYQNSMTPLGYYYESNAKADTTFIISAGAAGEIGYSDVDFWAADDVYLLLTQDSIASKFLYHFLLLQQYKILAQVRRASIPRLSRIAIEKLQIPIPPLNVQAEIVRILDTFTELTARQQQYAYYRDQLMNIDVNSAGVKQMSLGEIYHFQYGKGNTIPKTGGEYPVYGSNGIVGSHHQYNSEDAPVIGHIGAYAGIVNWGKGKHFVTYNGVICRIKSEEVLSQYAYYILLLQNFGEKSNSASQPFVSYHILEAPVVPIPSLDEQQRIVSILDKFDALTTSLTEGLPREIELRQQQYEYYRDLLLSFPKPEVVAHD